MKALVKSCNICWVWLGMPNLLQNNLSANISAKGESHFVYLLDLVTYPWKLRSYHVVLVGYGPACPKFSEITNR